MFTEMETKPDICPLTLELCERCCEIKILGHQALCSFTLEPCCFNSTGDLSYADLQTETRRNTNQYRFNPLQERRITAAHR